MGRQGGYNFTSSAPRIEQSSHLGDWSHVIVSLFLSRLGESDHLRERIVKMHSGKGSTSTVHMEDTGDVGDISRGVWKVISVKSLLYVINVVIKKNAVFCKRSLKYPA